ncbi:MAG: DoxX family protein [Burkholderiales bacterium]|nr:DoxX family protein [Phycisphaerae bacterium]
MVWAGYIISTLMVLMLLTSATFKLLRPAFVVESFKQQGWPENISVPLGIVELACTILYIIPRTAVLGAILLTGYLGGAVATHVRLSEPFFVQVLFGMLVWLGLFLRDARVRALIPLRD